MKKHFLATLVASVILVEASVHGEQILFEADKRRAVELVEDRREQLIQLANQIWEFAETALQERESAHLLSTFLEAQGFRVKREVAGLFTGFTAEYGTGRPLIGILGEYDALPGLSQKAQPSQEARVPGAPGHGCGHNLLGAASAGAALALKDFLERTNGTGTIRFYGTPAEEAFGGKIYMIKAGLFDEVDAALTWHPSDRNEADVQSSQAIVDLKVLFSGRAAHAAYDPWNGRSALDGADLFMHAVNLMREHVQPTVRIHYVVEDGGLVPNIVPEKASVWCWIRDSRRDGVAAVLERVRKAAEGAALATETEVEVRIEGGDYEVLPNRNGALLMYENLQWLGPIEYTEEETTFALTLQKNLGVPAKGLNGSIREWRETMHDPEGGSTDVGDVSWIVPVVNMTATTAPTGVPWHGWGVVASGGMSIGHQGMLLAAKALATTGIDLFLNAEGRSRVIEEFREKTRDQTYVSFVSSESPPGATP